MRISDWSSDVCSSDLVASHFSIMVRGLSQLFAAGPAVAAAIGDTLDREELGGSDVHTRNGVVDDEVASEAEAFEAERRLLSYLPLRNPKQAPRLARTNRVAGRARALSPSVPRHDSRLSTTTRGTPPLFPLVRALARA